MIDVAYSRVLTTIDIRLSIYRWFYDGLRRKIYNFANDTVFFMFNFLFADWMRKGEVRAWGKQDPWTA